MDEEAGDFWEGTTPVVALRACVRKVAVGGSKVGVDGSEAGGMAGVEDGVGYGEGRET